MNKKARILLCVLLAFVLAGGALLIYAAENYSSKEDPLISLSYINEVVLPKVTELISDALEGKDISEVTLSTEIPEKEPEIEYPEGTEHTGGLYAIVQLEDGKCLFASPNVCEVIVRAGNAVVVSPFTTKWEEQGISDATDGVELYDGAAVPVNHTLLIPRDDGRGIVADGGSVWLLVRGDYRIETAEVKDKDKE